MRPSRPNHVRLARSEPYLVLRIAHEDPQLALEHVERVLDVRVEMPRHLLRGRDLQLVDPKPRTLRVPRATLDFIECARVLDALHAVLLILHPRDAHPAPRSGVATFPTRSPSHTTALATTRGGARRKNRNRALVFGRRVPRERHATSLRMSMVGLLHAPLRHDRRLRGLSP